jgi:1,4-dihydroxy-2-naphthoate octaprenyltransferase
MYITFFLGIRDDFYRFDSLNVNSLERIHPIRKWAVVFRLHSLLFIIPPYILGVLVAVIAERHVFNLALILVGFLTLVLYHIAGNLLSDIHDYRKGIDKEANFFSGGIVRGWITMRHAKRLVAVLFSLALFVGTLMVWQVGIILLPFIILGLILGIFYSTGDKYAFKYNVTGEWFILLGFGLLIPAYGYLLNAGQLTLTPFLYSLPAAFLIAAVKHANNWIASLTPGNLEKYTTATLIGQKASRIFYYGLVILPYALVFLMVFWDKIAENSLPPSMLVTYLSLPLLMVSLRRAAKARWVNSESRVLGLDSLTAMLYILFISLSCISVVIG